MDLQPVTLIIPAYNESPVLLEKIQNTLDLDYPRQLLTVIVVTDGSDDGSERSIGQFQGFIHLHDPVRKGKFAAIKRAMSKVNTPIVIFSDANALLNRESIDRIVKHYADPGVGAVAGEKKIVDVYHRSGVGEAEGFYWKYESFMKRLDAGFNTVVGAAGELFSIRTALFKEWNDEIILDDFWLSMNCSLSGYRIAYEAGAYAVEMPSASLQEEEKRKVRIAAGSYQAIALLKECLNFFKHPQLAFQYFSRRLLRWVFCPWFILGLFISNFLIAIEDEWMTVYDWLFYGQVLFYALAIIGWLIVQQGKKAGILSIPFYFLFMNYCLVKGFFRFLHGSQTALWEKSVRIGKSQQGMLNH